MQIFPNFFFASEVGMRNISSAFHLVLMLGIANVKTKVPQYFPLGSKCKMTMLSSISSSNSISCVFAPEKTTSHQSIWNILFPFSSVWRFFLTDSCASSTLTMQPSKLYHSHPMPSSSSYGDKSLTQIFSKELALYHPWNFRWIPLPIPYSWEISFHWRPGLVCFYRFPPTIYFTSATVNHNYFALLLSNNSLSK